MNLFRQDRGYRSGTYQKSWRGREDNEVLAELMLTLDSDAPEFQARVYAALADAYDELTGS